MAKGLGKHSFLKSVEEYENRGVNFVDFAAKNEKSERVEVGRAPSRLTSTALPSRLRSGLTASRVNSASRVNGREWDRELDVEWIDVLRARMYPPPRVYREV
jgi:hypothetical protein